MVVVRKYLDFMKSKPQTVSSQERDEEVYFSCFSTLKIEKSRFRFNFFILSSIQKLLH